MIAREIMNILCGGEGGGGEISYPPLHVNGTIMQTDGWVDFSNYTGTGYIETPKIWKPENNAWEMYFVIRITKTGEKYNTIIAANHSSHYTAVPCIQWDTTKYKFAVAYPDDNRYWRHVLWSTNNYSTNGNYYLKYLWDGQKIELYVSTDGVDWIREISQSEALPCYQTSEPNSFMFGALGSDGGYDSIYSCGLINLSKSYIKVGNDIVWGNG